MPQMGPMNWLFLYIIFNISLLIFFIMIYYFMNKFVIKKEKIIVMEKKSLNKW